MGATGSKTPDKGPLPVDKGNGGGDPGGNGSSDSVVQVNMTVSIARKLLRALTLNESLTGPDANVLIAELSRVLLTATTGKTGKGTDKTGEKTPGGKDPGAKDPGIKDPGVKFPGNKIPLGKTG